MYRIRLDQFEGPLDLLLFFIRRDELDIYNIPIASIADEFLEYVKLMEEIDLDGVGDFLYMAAVLISIKTRILLPQPDLDEQGEPIDPRKELVERLLEYVRYKEAADSLSDHFDRRAELFTRSGILPEIESLVPDPPRVKDGTVFDLISALRRVLTEVDELPAHHVEQESYSVEEQLEYVCEVVRESKRITFSDLVAARSKAFIIATFLAILELSRQGDIEIRLSAGNFDFELCATDELLSNERAASERTGTETMTLEGE